VVENNNSWIFGNGDKSLFRNIDLIHTKILLLIIKMKYCVSGLLLQIIRNNKNFMFNVHGGFLHLCKFTEKTLYIVRGIHAVLLLRVNRQFRISKEDIK